MTKVFVSGSRKIKHLNSKVTDRLKNIVEAKYCVIVGDADGVDSSVQEYLKAHGAISVVVYCSGDKPRNNLGNWTTKNVATTSKPGTREFFTAKDKTMAEDCDYGFMVWDARSTGTLSNAIELVGRKKVALVYVNKEKQFLQVKDVKDIEALLAFMSETSLKKADEKIGVFKKVDAMKFAQHEFFETQQDARADVTPAASPRQGGDEKEVYAFYGLASYTAQVAERGLVQLALLLRLQGVHGETQATYDRKYDAISRQTFGQILQELSEDQFLEDDLRSLLTKALKARNRLTHHFFWDYAEQFFSEEGRLRMIQELQDATAIFLAVDDHVRRVIDLLAHELGVDRQAVDETFEEFLRDAQQDLDSGYYKGPRPIHVVQTPPLADDAPHD